LGQKAQAGEFRLPGTMELLRELREMLDATHLSRGLFLANHASNYLPLRVKMPADKEKALAMVDAALRGEISLKPEWRRAL
jgi:hypothetical protein